MCTVHSTLRHATTSYTNRYQILKEPFIQLLMAIDH